MREFRSYSMVALRGRCQGQGSGQVSAAGLREPLVPEAACGGKAGVPAGLAPGWTLLERYPFPSFRQGTVQNQTTIPVTGF